MDQIKVGKFIAKCRKEKGLTQESLAEKLGITYKAVSKWECGKILPDASIMIELCNLLDISVNELLTGEKLQQKEYQTQAEKNLVELNKTKELAATSSKISHIFTISLLLIINFINIFNYKIEEVISKPEFILMITISLIYFIAYTSIFDK